MIFQIFQLLFTAVRTEEVKFKSFDVEKRKIKLNLVDYCYDKITEVYIQEKDNKNTPIEKAELSDEKYPSILAIDIPDSVTTDFDILIIAEPQIIKIGSIRFNNNNTLSKSNDLKITCRYDGDTSSFNDKKKKFLEGKDVEEEYGDNNPTVKCYGTKEEIFIEFSRLEKYINLGKFRNFEEYINLDESPKIFVKKNSNVKFNIEFPASDFDNVIDGKKLEKEKNFDKITVFNFEVSKNENSRCVLSFKNLGKDLHDNPFWIRMSTEKYGHITLGSFIFSKKLNGFKGYANKRVRLYLSDDLKKQILTSVNNYKSFDLQSKITDDEKKSDKEEGQPKKDSKSSDTDSKPEKDIKAPQKKEKNLFKTILEDYFYQFLSVIAIFCVFFIFVLAILLKK